MAGMRIAHADMETLLNNHLVSVFYAGEERVKGVDAFSSQESAETLWLEIRTKLREIPVEELVDLVNT